MKAILLSCAALFVLSASGCAEKVEDRPLNAGECRELTTLELDLSIQAGRVPNIDAAKKEKFVTRATQDCLATGQFTTAYLACVKASKSTDEWEKCGSLVQAAK
jgi:hypothetical protein